MIGPKFRWLALETTLIRPDTTGFGLATEGEVGRQRLGPTFVYCSRKRSIAKQQTFRRKEHLKNSLRPRATSRQKIATLLELIKESKIKREEIVLCLKPAGVTITQELVNAVFEEYDLDKYTL